MIRLIFAGNVSDCDECAGLCASVPQASAPSEATTTSAARTTGLSERQVNMLGSDLATVAETQLISEALAASLENISDFTSADPNIPSSASERRHLASTNFDPNLCT